MDKQISASIVQISCFSEDAGIGKGKVRQAVCRKRILITKRLMKRNI